MFKAIIFISTILLTTLCQAQASENKTYSTWLNLGLGINFLSSGTESGASYNLQPEIGAAYYLNDNIGFFTGLGYTPYSIENFGSKAEISFIDIPVGLSFRYDNRFFPGAKSLFNMGLFFGLPLGDFELDGVKIADAETPMGLYIGGLTTFAISEDYRLGFGTTVKFPFGDVVNTADNSALSVAFNFVIQY